MYNSKRETKKIIELFWSMKQNNVKKNPEISSCIDDKLPAREKFLFSEKGFYRLHALCPFAFILILHVLFLFVSCKYVLSRNDDDFFLLFQRQYLFIVNRDEKLKQNGIKELYIGSECYAERKELY